MKHIILFLILAAGVLLAANSWGASSCAESSSRVGSQLSMGTVRVLTLAWTAGSDSLFSSFQTAETITGRIVKAITIPDTSAAGKRMADNYDIALKTADGEDIFGVALANRDSVTVETAIPLCGSMFNSESWVASKLILSISGLNCAGAKGRVKIYWIAR
jgi:hypothetical protein